MSWCEDMNSEKVDCFINEFVKAKFFVNQHYLATSALKLVLKLDFPLVMAHVKSRCEDYVRALVHELEVRFPNHEFMLTLGVIYPNLCAKTP
jgi:hypothetical protein